MQRNRWQLADTWLPFPEGRLPVGEEGTGRLVTVSVKSKSSAVFSERHTLTGASLGLPILARLAGEVRLEAGYVRVTVYASAFSVLVVGVLSGVFLLSGLHVFLSQPGLGTAVGGGMLVATGSWLLHQIPRAGREVAADAVHILGVMARDEGQTAFTA